MNYNYYIGVDCGVKTGLCIWDKEGKKIKLLITCKIHEAMQTVQAYHLAWPGEVFVRIEDARLRKWIPRQKNEKAERGRREGAGSVKRDAKIWEDYLTDIEVDYEMVAPKNNKTKVDAKKFKMLTGWTEITSEHARDAALLVIAY